MQEDSQVKAEINSYARRCFRDVADLDYIAARLSYRATLGAQFLWSAQQAIEKYLKCILIFNRVPTGHLRHDLQAAWDEIHAKTDITIKLTEPEGKLFKRLNDFGPNRYLEYSWTVYPDEIVILDSLVWYLRQFCQTTVGIATHAVTQNMRAATLKAIESSRDLAPKNGYILNGKLESILNKKNHPARPALIWANLCYSGKTRKRVLLRRWWHAENAPLWLRPEILSHIETLVYVSKSAKSGYQKLAAQRKKDQRR